MKIANLTKGFLLTLSLSMAVTFSMAQRVKASPDAEATGTIDGAHIKIQYNSPAVKGRKIYGTDLVPYGKVWRTGADSATRFTTDKDIKVEGKTLKAGTYTFYAIAGEKEWVLIFNSKLHVWGINHDGTTTEDPAMDVLRVTVKPKASSEMHERLVYNIHDKGFVLSWENLDVPVSIK